jgi:hypothetical protein
VSASLAYPLFLCCVEAFTFGLCKYPEGKAEEEKGRPTPAAFIFKKIKNN